MTPRQQAVFALSSAVMSNTPRPPRPSSGGVAQDTSLAILPASFDIWEAFSGSWWSKHHRAGFTIGAPTRQMLRAMIPMIWLRMRKMLGEGDGRSNQQ